ncbi:MAG: hypothetical protein BGN85_12570 [Alphaproteobacteria bacterium 64-11]|nr:MAG: hypothetical protein BGN85_12570 [Alphaproteobacteria bacterium 64-11]
MGKKNDMPKRNPFSFPLIATLLLSVVFLLTSYSLLGPPTASDSVRLDFLRVATHEIGFAFVVSSLIWVCFEFYKATQDDDHWNERIERISKNVFFGVWKKNFPDDLIRAAGRLILDQTFIRSGLHITYTIMDDEYEGAGGRVPFVKLNAVATSRLRNVSNDVAELPIGIALPNPMIDEMKSFCRLNRVSIKKDGQEISQSLEAAEAKFREDMKDDSVSQVPMHIQNITLDPDEEIEMLLDYTMAKEVEDTEIFTTRFPADSIVLTIHDHGGVRRVVRARSIHQTNLDNDTSADAQGSYNFKLQQYLLPQQGFVIWWKSVPNRGAPAPGASAPGAT